MNEQDHQFGSSPFLQSDDYHEPAAYPSFAQSFHKTTSALTFVLKAQHTGVLSSVLLNQFRVTLTPATFTNNAGTHETAAPGVTAGSRRAILARAIVSFPCLDARR